MTPEDKDNELRRIAREAGLSPHAANQAARELADSKRHAAELFKYARDIMGLDAHVATLALARALSKTLVEDLRPQKSDTLFAVGVAILARTIVKIAATHRRNQDNPDWTDEF